MTILQHYPLRALNTFGIDVTTEYFIDIHSLPELREALRLPGEKLFLGGGSNILFTGNYNGTVIKVSLRGIDIEREDEQYVYMRVAAGEQWHSLVRYCVERNLGGVENLSLIPGTVGAAPIQNIGAYGTELKDVLVSVEGLYIETGSPFVLSNEECRFGYRTSIFKQDLRHRVVITSVLLRLSKEPCINLSYPALAQAVAHLPAHSLTVRDISDAVCSVRRSKLPDPADVGNAGSFFKNPEVPREVFERIKVDYPQLPSYPTQPGFVKLPAGWLIEQCGWKGRKIGNAGTYPLQALVLVNYGGASGSDVLAVAHAIQHDVQERFGITIEPEVNIL
jgi:UDP-N-acetylmuramate dehydrogenase